MTMSIGGAASAYANTMRGASGLEPRETRDPGTDFANLVKNATSSATETGLKAETVTAQAIQGKADLAEVVVAVTNAEVALDTVVAIRDRVIQAYQEIIRMPL